MAARRVRPALVSVATHHLFNLQEKAKALDRESLRVVRVAVQHKVELATRSQTLWIWGDWVDQMNEGGGRRTTGEQAGQISKGGGLTSPDSP